MQLNLDSLMQQQCCVNVNKVTLMMDLISCVSLAIIIVKLAKVHPVALLVTTTPNTEFSLQTTAYVGKGTMRIQPQVLLYAHNAIIHAHRALTHQPAVHAI
jgi:hypothetical protein